MPPPRTVGAVGLLALVCLCCLCIVMRKKEKKPASSDDTCLLRLWRWLASAGGAPAQDKGGRATGVTLSMPAQRPDEIISKI